MKTTGIIIVTIADTEREKCMQGNKKTGKGDNEKQSFVSNTNGDTHYHTGLMHCKHSQKQNFIIYFWHPDELSTDP